MPAVQHGSLPFDEQIEFFRDKVNVPTERWNDLWQQEHDYGFMVAGATRESLLNDLRAAVGKAIEEGTTLEQFRQDFDKTVARHGWAYTGGRNWRTRVIYETNLKTSYQAGRYQQMKNVAESRPYWRYRHSDSVENPREQHLSWDGKTLRHDHPWWDKRYPPNGWGCECYVDTLAARDVNQPDEPPTDLDDNTGIDDGFAYAPGQSRLAGVAPPPREAGDTVQETLAAASGALPADDDMPAPRQAEDAAVMESGRDEQEYVDAFLEEFGLDPATDREELFQDVTGEILPITQELFRDQAGNLKVSKRGRERHVRLIARTIREPDEIWAVFAGEGDDGRATFRRRYLARWQLPGETVPTVAVFEYASHGWQAVTGISSDDQDYLERRGRVGQRLYKRQEE